MEPMRPWPPVFACWDSWRRGRPWSCCRITGWEEKYRQLGRPVPSPAFGIPSQDQLDHWRAMAQAMGRRVVSYR
ncbi:MAG: hypothetical protein ACLR53_06035 [Evtepia gabavorous]